MNTHHLTESDFIVTAQVTLLFKGGTPNSKNGVPNAILINIKLNRKYPHTVLQVK